jgi:hypothetical protein
VIRLIVIIIEDSPSLSTAYKILSNILLDRLTPYVNEVIGDHQCGFHHNRSTTHQISYIQQILEKKWEYNGVVLTYSMVQDIIWKADCQKNPAFLWNPKVHRRVHKSPPLDPILSQPNPVRPVHSFLPKVHFNVILPPMPRSSQWSLAFGPPNQNPVNTSPLPHACHMSSLPHPPWLNHPNNIRSLKNITNKHF